MSRIVIVSAEPIVAHRPTGANPMGVALSELAAKCRRGLKMSWKIVSAWYL